MRYGRAVQLVWVASGVIGHHDSNAVAEWIAADHDPASVEP